MVELGLIQKYADEIITEGWTDGIAVKMGSIDKTYSLFSGTIGSNSYNPTPVTNTTLYDLASVTKIFSLIAIMRLIEGKKISLDSTIGSYTNKFPSISTIKIYELMNFSKQLRTAKRLEFCLNIRDAVNLLYDITVSDTSIRYTDMGIIILTQIINEILDSPHGFQYYTENLWNDIGLKNTYWWTNIPNNMRLKTQSYDHEYKINDGIIQDFRTAVGTVHDKKAQILEICGHAGVFSTPEDISIIVRKLLEGEILSKESIRTIVLDKYSSYAESQTFGMLCYKKHANPQQSEIPAICSNGSIAISGYTGTYLLIDFTQKVYLFIGSNRISKRITYMDTLSDAQYSYKYVADYVYRKDALRDICVQKLLARNS